MIIELSESNKVFIVSLLYEEKSRLIAKFRKKTRFDVTVSPCDYHQKMQKVRELISILGDANE